VYEPSIRAVGPHGRDERIEVAHDRTERLAASDDGVAAEDQKGAVMEALP